MIGQFGPLDEAYERASRAWQQQQVLAPIPAAWTAYTTAQRDSAAAETAQGTSAERYLRGVHLALLRTEITRADADIAGQDVDLADREQQAAAAKATFRSLDDQLRAEGADLNRLETDLGHATGQHATRLAAYQIFSGHLAALGLPAPQDQATFTALRGQLPALLAQATGQQQDLQPRCRDAAWQAGEAASRHRERATELAAVAASGSLLPARVLERREVIARGAEVPAEDLAYAAELIDLAAGEERWRPAAEKVLRSYGLRLLVPDRHKQAVQAYIDQHDMRGVIDYSIVTAVSAHQPRPAPGTLAAKLEVDVAHPSGFWLGVQLTRRFEHVCVETAAALEPHPVAVDRTRHRQAARRPLPQRRPARGDQPASWILGGNITTKRAALESDVAELATARQQADATADQLDTELARATAVITAVGQLAAYPSWNDLDHWAAAAAADDLAAADQPAQGRQRQPATAARPMPESRNQVGAAGRCLRDDPGRHHRPEQPHGGTGHGRRHRGRPARHRARRRPGLPRRDLRAAARTSLQRSDARVRAGLPGRTGPAAAGRRAGSAGRGGRHHCGDQGVHQPVARRRPRQQRRRRPLRRRLRRAAPGHHRAAPARGHAPLPDHDQRRHSALGQRRVPGHREPPPRRSAAAPRWSTPDCGRSSSTRAPTCRSPGHPANSTRSASSAGPSMTCSPTSRTPGPGTSGH